MNAANIVNPEGPFERAMQLAFGFFEDHALRERLAVIVARKWRTDPDNLRDLTPEEIAGSAPWVQKAADEGRKPKHFKPSRASEANIRRFLLRVRAALDVLDEPPPPSPGKEAHLRARIAKFSENIFYLNFDQVDAASRAHNRLRSHVQRHKEAQLALDEIIYPPQEVRVGRKFVWRIVPSPRRLGDVGVRMQVCTAFHRPEFPGYARRLRNREVEFWTMEDENGAPQILLMVSARDRVVQEVKGPENAYVKADFGPYKAFLRKRKIKPQR